MNQGGTLTIETVHPFGRCDALIFLELLNATVLPSVTFWTNGMRWKPPPDRCKCKCKCRCSPTLALGPCQNGVLTSKGVDLSKVSSVAAIIGGGDLSLESH
jgi:hypothetical protein